MKTLLLCLLVAGALAAPATKPQFKRGLNKIVGGTNAFPGELPYQVSLQDLNFDNGWHFCGGTIYKDTWVVTASHCIASDDWNNPSYLQIVAGELDFSYEEGGEQRIVLSKIIGHENFDSFALSDDVALLQLSSTITFTKYAQPIAMPSFMQESSGECIVSGWGALTEGGGSPDILQKVTVNVISDADCTIAYGEGSIFDSMICAGIPEGGKDSCQGDSGGPLACTNADGSSYLCGIVSWGYGCARPGQPGVYTEVSHFIDWMETNSA